MAELPKDSDTSGQLGFLINSRFGENKEANMATAKRREFTDYCDTLFSELTDMKERLNCLVVDINEMPMQARLKVQSHIPHLEEIMKTIDWKLEILTRVCPFEWAGYGPDVETQVSDGEPGTEMDIGGYVGG